MKRTLSGRRGAPFPKGRALRPWLLRFYRLAVVVAVVWLLRQHSPTGPTEPIAPPPLAAVRVWFPDMARLGPVASVRQSWPVLSEEGRGLGQVLRTSPQSNSIIGYAGPSDLLIAEDPDGTVRGVSILQSADTRDHILAVERDPGFAVAFQGWQPGAQPVPKVEAVSGSTLTSLAMAEAVARRLGAAPASLRFPEPVNLDEVKRLFPDADACDGKEIRDKAGQLIGQVLRTSPASDGVRGHAGPTESLIALEPDGKTVKGVRLRKSYDTADYVDQVKDDRLYLKAFSGRTLEQLAAMDFGREGIEGVSGATETSYAVAEGLKRRAALATALPLTKKSQWTWKPSDIGLGLVVLGSLLLAFTRLRGNRWVRLAWQAVLIGYVGLVSHDLLSLGLLTGWGSHGPAWSSAPALVLLGAAALLVPWATGRQVYCHQICPHGAAQLWLGRITKKKIHVPAAWGRWLERLPAFLLVLGTAGALGAVPVSPAALEPFDAWAWRAAGIGVMILAAAGLLAAIFIPQAYCRYGCPTGALLKWVRTTGSGDHFTRRDAAALACVVAAAGWVYAPALINSLPAVAEPAGSSAAVHQVSGRIMGTTWSLKIRDPLTSTRATQEGVQAQLDRVENLLSTWRQDTPVALFNQAATTAAHPLPNEVLTLLRHGQRLAAITGGAYDLTVGPLVKAWGYGPPPRPANPPRPDELTGLLPRIGYQKLTMLPEGVARGHPALELDFTSLAEGYALDRASDWLAAQGAGDFLLEVGGELRASGTWQVAVELPAEPLILTSRSLATSGTYRQWRVRREKGESHLIDPRTGYPVQHGTITVSVLAADGLSADSWATALNVLGAAEGLPLANQLGLAARFVEEESPGNLRISRSHAWMMPASLSAGEAHHP